MVNGGTPVNNKIRQIVSIVLTVGAVGTLLTSCGEKPPAEEMTTGTEIHKLVDTYGVLDTDSKAAESKTGKPEEKDKKENKNGKDKSKATGADAETEKTTEAAKETSASQVRVSDVEFVLQSYYTDGTNYGEIQNITFDEKAFASTAYGYLDVKMTYVATRDRNLVICYRAYDADGKVCRNARIAVRLDGVKSGDTVERIRFNVPFNAVKVEFFDYVKEVQQ